MKRTIIFLTVLLISGISVFAQQSTTKGKGAPEPILKPKFLVGDIYFAAQALENIEISGNEVEPFIEVKNLLKNALQKCQDENKKVTDEQVVEIPISQGQNLLSFLNRAKFTGRMAEQYKRFVDSLVESSKNLPAGGQ